jgi:hypothetical protein
MEKKLFHRAQFREREDICQTKSLVSLTFCNTKIPLEIEIFNRGQKQSVLQNRERSPATPSGWKVSC